MPLLWLASLLLLSLGWSEAMRCGCDYATSPAISDADFVSCMALREGRFLRVGLDSDSGMTRDGARISQATGLPIAIHNFSAPSKESLHLALIAQALSGNTDAQLFLISALCTSDDLASCQALAQVKGRSMALKMLEQKMTILEEFAARYPGYGGYLPWFQVVDGMIEPVADWSNPFRVPGLDNGEMIWGMAACAAALKNTTDAKELLSRLEAYLALLAKTGPIIFIDNVDSSCVRSVSFVHNISANPTVDNYSRAPGACLDDPYEGEMLVVFMELFSPQAKMDPIWKRKLGKIVPVSYGGSIVQQGFWFSSHEQWKYVFLPYTLIKVQKTIFQNGERARAWHSAMHSIPGLYASCTNVTNSETAAPPYLSATGIAALGSQPINSTFVVSPYGSWTLMLANQTCGIAWYKNMISASGMSGPLGSSEATSVDGTEISPVITWDTKITTLVSALGGVFDLVQSFLEETDSMDHFQGRINSTYFSVFGAVQPSMLPFRTPTAQIPRGKISTSMCQVRGER